ncbi:GNAT family N-acetyltransferase [Flavobacterium sp. XS1P32]|uniref:GNAT family N-acetyltransferase n=1 Tax=Flavobacterium sp. XS1P32 TaxID=3401726 RepID=UPI003AADC803
MITENEKLLIRELSENDVNVIFELYSDKEAMKFRGSKPFENIEEAIIMIKKVIENIKSGTEFRYAIIEKMSNELIGTFLITPITSVICMVGCSIGKNYWRLGYGLEVMSLMSKYLENLEYEKIIGLIKKENIPSIKLVEKMQFKLIEQNEYPEFYKYEKEINI